MSLEEVELNKLIKGKTVQELPSLITSIKSLISQGHIQQSVLIYNEFDKEELKVASFDANEMLSKFSPWGIKLHFKAHKFIAISNQTAFTIEAMDYEREISRENFFIQISSFNLSKILLFNKTTGEATIKYERVFNEYEAVSSDLPVLDSLLDKAKELSNEELFKKKFSRALTGILESQKRKAH